MPGTPTAASIPPGFIVTYGPLGQLLDNAEGARPVTAVAYQVNVGPSGTSPGISYRVEVNNNGSLKICVPGAAASMVCSAP